jgi:hypothetical protein
MCFLFSKRAGIGAANSNVLCWLPFAADAKHGRILGPESVSVNKMLEPLTEHH